MPRVNMKKLLERDLALKGGPELDKESENLSAIYFSQARKLTREWLERLGQGDEDQNKPLQSRLLRQLVRTVAVVWRRPPTRIVTLDETDLPDGDETSKLVDRLYSESKADAYLKALDRSRTLLGTTLGYVSPNPRGGPPLIRVFAPHNVLRNPEDSVQDDPSYDSEVAFRVAAGKDKEDSVYHYFVREDERTLRAWRVKGNGDLAGEEDDLFEGGLVPYEVAPYFVLYDELSEGRAWLPIDETRSAFALTTNVILSELTYLVKQEAHSILAASNLSPGDQLPSRFGPGMLFGFEGEVDLKAVAMNPKLEGVLAVHKHLLEILSSGEGLPPDYFLSTRRYETGAAGRLRMQDLEERRQEQMQDAVRTEAGLFEILRVVHNATDGREVIEEDARLRVELARPWFPTDVAEQQRAAAFDLSLGAMSMIDYVMDRHQLSRSQAIAYLERVNVDRERYPVRENPAALLTGPRAANGPGSATPAMDDDAQGVERDSSTINPNRAASNEQGSVVGAARRAVKAV